MKQQIKWFVLAGWMLLMGLQGKAQQLSGVYLTENGRASYLISVDQVQLLLNDSGKLAEIRTAASGNIVYNVARQIEQVGNVKIGLNYQGKINRVGSAAIVYDFNGRIDRIGELSFRYNYNNLLAAVGNQSIRYNPDQTVDQFDRYRIVYNYNKQVQKIDDSGGLIILQYIFNK